MNKNQIALLILLWASWLLFAIAAYVLKAILLNELLLSMFWPWLLGFPIGFVGTIYCLIELKQ
jgi:hypothetical protein